VLLHEDASEPESSRDGCDLAGVVRLNAADRDERVAILGERLGREVLELAYLVASVSQSRVAVLPLGPDIYLAAKVLAEPGESVHRRRAEQKLGAVEVFQAHPSIRVRSFTLDSSIWVCPGAWRHLKGVQYQIAARPTRPVTEPPPTHRGRTSNMSQNAFYAEIETRMNAEDLTEIDRAGRRCSACRSGRHWRQFSVLRPEGGDAVVMCAACRVRYGDLPPAQPTREAPVAPASPTKAPDDQPPKQREDRLKKVLRELPRGEHSTGRIAKAAGLNNDKTFRRLRQLEDSGEVRQVGKRWSTQPAPTDLEGAFERLQARTSNIRIVREDRSRA
jgi:hypothetical protein